MENLLGDLKNKLKIETKNSREILDSYSRDASLFKIKPQAVVFPKNTEDIKNLVRFAREAKSRGENVSLTARSGGTDMTGGPLTESVVVDMAKHFGRIKEVGSDFATTEPGVFYRDFDKATRTRGLILPSYTASREICTVGGMIANNSGGEKTLTYGKTEDYVEELKVVLQDGNEYVFKPLSPEALEDKKKQDDFEGEIYRRTFELVKNNYDILQSAKPSVSKNSSGYFLWNVWNKDTGRFDLTKLFVGSQGTLGIVTEARLKLIKPKTHSRLLVIFLKDLHKLADLIGEVLKSKPESFESYDDHTLRVAVRVFPDLIKKLKGNFFKLLWNFLPEFWMVLTGGMPKLILIAEFTADTDKEAYEKCVSAKMGIEKFNLPTKVTKTSEESEKYWVIRRESFNLLRKNVHGLHTAPFIDDIIVKPSQLPEFLPKLYNILDQYKIIYTIAGHVGDANFHIIPLMDLHKTESRKIITELSEKVYDLVFQFKGSISGEHNDGLIRSPFLEKMYGPEVYKLFEETKKIFDPDNIFNPGKKVGASLDYSLNHLDVS
ncbi:MAG: FAD-binding oxidoreductase [bacterium]|nr:FAD-binding oxidoreductase [bacterium]